MKQTDPQYKLRLPTALKDKLDAAAAKHEHSLNAEIVERLESTFQFDNEDRGLLEVDLARARIEVMRVRSVAITLAQSVLMLAPVIDPDKAAQAIEAQELPDFTALIHEAEAALSKYEQEEELDAESIPLRDLIERARSLQMRRQSQSAQK